MLKRVLGLGLGDADFNKFPMNDVGVHCGGGVGDHDGNTVIQSPTSDSAGALPCLTSWMRTHEGLVIASDNKTGPGQMTNEKEFSVDGGQASPLIKISWQVHWCGRIASKQCSEGKACAACGPQAACSR